MNLIYRKQRKELKKEVKKMKKLLILAVGLFFLAGSTAMAINLSESIDPDQMPTTDREWERSSVTHYDIYGTAVFAVSLTETKMFREGALDSEGNETGWLETVTQQIVTSLWIGGSLKTDTMQVVTDSRASDGSTMASDLTRSYVYSESGNLIDAVGEGISTNKDGETGHTTISATKEEFTIRDGEALSAITTRTNREYDKSGVLSENQISETTSTTTFSDYEYLGGSWYSGKDITHTRSTNVINGEIRGPLKESIKVDTTVYNRQQGGVITGIEESGYGETRRFTGIDINLESGETIEAVKLTVNESKTTYGFNLTEGWVRAETVSNEREEVDYKYYDTSEKLMGAAWAALSTNDLNSAKLYANKCIELFDQYVETEEWAKNDVATAYLIKGMILQKTGNMDAANVIYDDLIENSRWAGAKFFDPELGDNGEWVLVADAAERQKQIDTDPFLNMNNEDLTNDAWHYYNHGDAAETHKRADEMITRYNALSSENQNEDWAKNMVALAMWFKAGAYRMDGDTTSAEAMYNRIIDEFPDATCPDDLDGDWNIAESAQWFIDVMDNPYLTWENSWLLNAAWQNLDENMDLEIAAEIESYVMELERRWNNADDAGKAAMVNDMGTGYWILAEALRITGNDTRANEYYQLLAADDGDFAEAECWDPVNAAWWSIKDAANDRLNNPVDPDPDPIDPDPDPDPIDPDPDPDPIDPDPDPIDPGAFPGYPTPPPAAGNYAYNLTFRALYSDMNAMYNTGNYDAALAYAGKLIHIYASGAVEGELHFNLDKVTEAYDIIGKSLVELGRADEAQAFFDFRDYCLTIDTV